MNLIISCISALDRLGHVKMNNEIVHALKSIRPDLSISSYALAIDDKYVDLNSNAQPIDAGYGSKLYTLENKRLLFLRFQALGKFIFSIYRMYIGIRYYYRLYKLIKTADVLIDLEFEPIFSVIFHLLKQKVPFKSHLCVVHSFPNGKESGFKLLYKNISLYILKLYVKKSSIIGLMTEEDLATARSRGFEEHQIVLVGWGLEQKRFNPNTHSLIDKSISSSTNFLMAGTLRKDKEIEKVIRLFHEISIPEFRLLIAGYPVDVKISSLEKIISDLELDNSIKVIGRYFSDQEFNQLFIDCDVVVLSHSSQFYSMSGPLLMALEMGKPILCLSSNSVSKLVADLGAGLLLHLEETHNIKAIKEQLRVLKDMDYKIPDEFMFSWNTITKRCLASLKLLDMDIS
jgi:glycosyltransferase involved in cell wall biosynthesis